MEINVEVAVRLMSNKKKSHEFPLRGDDLTQNWFCAQIRWPLRALRVFYNLWLACCLTGCPHTGGTFLKSFTSKMTEGLITWKWQWVAKLGVLLLPSPLSSLGQFSSRLWEIAQRHGALCLFTQWQLLYQDVRFLVIDSQHISLYVSK